MKKIVIFISTFCVILISFYLALNLKYSINTSAASGTEYYIAKNGSDLNSGTKSSPFQNIGFCMYKVVAGDTCLVNDGEYFEYNLDTLNSGTALNPILVKSINKHGAIINAIIESTGVKQATGITFNGTFGNNKKYITVDGFEVKNPEYSCLAGKYSEHITFINNKVHDCGGGGIGSNQSDYIVVKNNVIYNNAFTSIYNESGISLYQNRNSDTLPGFHNIISGNLTYGNKNTVPFLGIPANGITDGNGIIIDDARNEQDNGTDNYHTPYTQETLIENNISVNNGGKGIHVFLSDNVTVRNNTVSGNSNSLVGTDAGDLSNVYSSNNKWYNNLVINVQNPYNNSLITNTSYNTSNLTENNTFKNNLGYKTNGSIQSLVNFDTPAHSIPLATNFLGIDPVLLSPLNSQIDPVNFTPLPNSPAINSSDVSNSATVDFFGNTRDSAPDIGVIEIKAKQSPAPLSSTSLLVPLYIYPDGTQNFPGWTDLAAQAVAHPKTKIVAIISHFGTNIWTDSYAKTQFQNGISLLKNSGITVLGYVPTTYTARPLTDFATQKTSIPSLESYFGVGGLSGVDGVFIDEVCSGYIYGNCSASSLQYYKNTKSLITQYKPSALIVGNPGGPVSDPIYYETANIIVNFENSESTFNLTNYLTQASSSKQKNGVLLYNSLQTNRSFIESLLPKVGMIYLTGDSLPNPWDTLPSNLSNYLTWIDEYNSPSISTSSANTVISSQKSAAFVSLSSVRSALATTATNSTLETITSLASSSLAISNSSTKTASTSTSSNSSKSSINSTQTSVQSSAITNKVEESFNWYWTVIPVAGIGLFTFLLWVLKSKK